MPEPPPEIGDSVRQQLNAIREPVLGSIPTNVFAQQAESPADTEAIYDFHTLQVAYPYVWASLEDGLLYDRIIDFYETRNRIQYGPEHHAALRSDSFDVPQSVDEVDRDLRGSLLMKNAEPLPVPPRVVRWLPRMSPALWGWIGSDERQRFLDYIDSHVSPDNPDVLLSSGEVLAAMRDEVARLHDEMELEGGPTRSWARMLEMVKETQERLRETYAFDVFHPRSYNYGLLATYRQHWSPGPYQTGDLVATLPLAPGESRKFSAKRVVTKKRSDKEAENALEHRRQEESKTSRAEADIARKATTRGSFTNTSEAGSNLVVSNSANTTVVSGDTARESARTKKEFREATRKACAEYRTERTIEVETSSTEQIEESTSGEVKNPNNEITVTYLFYELQRQYRIRERLHKVQPVIMVAQPVPAPHEVDEDWLLAHEWILRRVLLDDRFHPALDYLTGQLLADEQSIALKREQVRLQRRVVREMEARMATLIRKRESAREALRSAIKGQADTQGFFEDVGEFLFGGEDDTEAARAKLEAAERAIETLESDLTEAQSQFTANVTSLGRATEELAESLNRQVGRRMAVDQLRIHVKDNILYYMQAIWDHEVPDQRYHRLYDVEVDVPLPPDGRVGLRRVDDKLRDVAGARGVAGGLDVWGYDRPRYKLGPLVESISDDDEPDVAFETKWLVEVADLDNPLGYHGNYIIFPLRESNFLTTFMSLSYLGDDLALWDPDEAANYDVDVVVERLREMRKQDADWFDGAWDAIREGLRAIVSSDTPAEETVVVPWEHLFVEALVGHHPLLETFKLRHREIDAEKAKAEVRELDLENIRRSALLLSGENLDPQVDKRIMIDGSGVVPVAPTDSG